MKIKNSYLVFEVNKSLFALKSENVVELIWLPELSPIETSYNFIIGYFNFRGNIIPVIDLAIRQNLKTKRYTINDRILVTNYNSKVYGIHIHEIYNVVQIEEETLEEYKHKYHSQIVSHVLNTEFGMTQILNLDDLSNFELSNIEAKKTISETYLSKLIGEISDQEKEIYFKRKNSYQIRTKINDFSKKISYVFFRLFDEYFCIELKYILEFVSAEGISKIPCTPKHISGCYNQRGDILIIIDLLFILKNQENKNLENKKIIVIKNEEFSLGFLVDELLDVTYLTSNSIINTPLDKKHSEKEFLKGTFYFKEQIAGILNIEKIFEYEKLNVEEYVTSENYNESNF